MFSNVFYCKWSQLHEYLISFCKSILLKKGTRFINICRKINRKNYTTFIVFFNFHEFLECLNSIKYLCSSASLFKHLHHESHECIGISIRPSVEFHWRTTCHDAKVKSKPFPSWHKTFKEQII